MFSGYEAQYPLKIKHLIAHRRNRRLGNQCGLTMISDSIELNATSAKHYMKRTNPYLDFGYIRHKNELYAYYSEGDECLVKIAVSTEQLEKFDTILCPPVDETRILSQSERTNINNILGSCIDRYDMKESEYVNYTYTIHVPAFIKQKSKSFSILIENIKQNISKKEHVNDLGYDGFNIIAWDWDVYNFEVTPLEQNVIDEIVQQEIEAYKKTQTAKTDALIEAYRHHQFIQTDARKFHNFDFQFTPPTEDDLNKQAELPIESPKKTRGCAIM